MSLKKYNSWWLKNSDIWYLPKKIKENLCGGWIAKCCTSTWPKASTCYTMNLLLEDVWFGEFLWSVVGWWIMLWKSPRSIRWIVLFILFYFLLPLTSPRVCGLQYYHVPITCCSTLIWWYLWQTNIIRKNYG